ncbi:hypothetical protein [Carnobacterium maltaromaticum]|uniref:hypothetical protein n=1 Tax=Carnobacterium maltaromaticum TaxID=2751 RepID=UPI0012F7D4B6|nr:hypothetical protein [Carnobacterium maltaromaticum]
MTKIDESKQFKFSEIIAMLENKELQENSVVEHGNTFLKVHKNGIGLGLKDVSNDRFIQATISVVDINAFWVINLPKEDKYYLKAPGAFKSKYLNLHIPYDRYFLSDNSGSEMYQTQFTQKEIDAMPFDTNFFDEPISVEQADE